MAAPAPSPRVFDGTLPPPSFASIETTMYCNLSCPFCIQFQDGTTVRGPHMEAATFEAVAAKLFPHLEVFQPSVSGEPLMSRGLERILELAARHGMRGVYHSNGTLLNDRLVAMILPTLGRLNISFDGATKPTFESLRRGAQFERVLENIRRVVAAARTLPPAERPQIGLACTLQEGNVRELPQLIDLAADLGLDFVGAAHVLPGTAEIQNWSLHRHRALAREHIGLAFARAQARGLPFWVQPLDELIVAMADEPEPVSPHSHARTIAKADGVEADVPAGSVNCERLAPIPVTPPRGADPASVAARRAARAEAERADAGSSYDAPIWTCDFLWNKLYVNHQGGAAPCCVPGVPELGSIARQPLEEVWNGEIQRTLRLGLVCREPAPCCRGCQHIRKVEDRSEIRRLLGGRAIPHERGPLPVALRPLRASAHAIAAPPMRSEHHAEAPRLAWPALAGAEGYEVEVSTDGYRTLLFTTAWHGIELDEPAFELPEWAWRLAPKAQDLAWRALAILPDHKEVVGAGAFAKLG